MQPIFEEKQYLGFNKYTVISRLSLALVCFLYYYINSGKTRTADLFLILGAIIVLISVILLFVLHLHTKVYPDSIVLEGFWTTRKVKISLKDIVGIEQVDYDPFFFNSPVYHLHKKGTIRFYTRGDRAVKLTDKDGLIYLIGSQNPAELTASLSGKTGQKV
jgi:hypothetical protein